MLHILDDFQFLGPPDSPICNLALHLFMSMCDVLGVPIKDEKTEGPSITLIYLGIELDTVKMEARLLEEKNYKNSKCTVQKDAKNDATRAPIIDRCA